MPLTRRARRWLVALSVLAALGLAAWWWIDRQLEPTRLATTVLDRVGSALQLRIGFDGTPEYALKPEPRLLLPGLTVAALQGAPFLTAKRAEISLPWATITGGEAVITRIQLDTPVLDLAGLQAWLASRPAEPFKLPTLTKGMEVKDGTILGAGFAVRALALELPSLQSGKPADLDASGQLEQGSTRVELHSILHFATPGLASDFHSQASGRLLRTPDPLEFKLLADGHFAFADAANTLELANFELSGDGAIPHLQGAGELRSTKGRLAFGIKGVLREWLAVWPALPEPLASQTSNLPVVINYAGKPDFGDPISLHIDKAPTLLDASLRLPELQAWLAADPGSPLPPLQGTLRTPVLVFDGVTLEGVDATVSEDVEPAGDAAGAGATATGATAAGATATGGTTAGDGH